MSEFEAAALEVKSLTTKPTDADLLILYGLFKQATVGDNSTPAPGMFDFKGKAKHAAWLAKAGLSKEDAETQYIAKVAELKAAN